MMRESWNFQHVTLIEMLVPTTSIERARITQRLTSLNASNTLELEHLWIEIDLQRNVITTYFRHDGEPFVLEKKRLMEALPLLMDFFQRNPKQVILRDQYGNCLDFNEPLIVMNHHQ